MIGTTDVVVGAGHNGLVAACYLARAGREVLVLEALDAPGGGARTEERLPGHRFDLHSVAHNIINMTDIPADLDLAGAGLCYQEMDPFSVAVHADGRRVRFWRSVDATVASIAEHDPAEAAAYRAFMADAVPLIEAILPAVGGRSVPRSHRHANIRRLARQPLGRVRDLLSPYESLLRRALPSDLTRGPVAAFAAHAGVGPAAGGSALFAYWQAAYHLHGQWHARGGSGALTDALVARLRSLGGEVRCSAPVARIEAPGGRVRAVVTEGGERIGTRSVITALDPKLALLELLDPPLTGPDADDLAATRRSNVVQAIIHVATDRLPPYSGSGPHDWAGLQSYVDRLDDLTAAWALAEAGYVPGISPAGGHATGPLPLYAFTTSAIDATLAPTGGHTVYLACPAAPAQVRSPGGWPAATPAFVEAALQTVEARAPGFGASITGVRPFLPDEMDQGSRWPGSHPMHPDIALDQLGMFRPTRRLGSHATPVEGLYISGAGTAPTGGIAGTPGRAAALRLLEDARRSRRGDPIP